MNEQELIAWCDDRARNGISQHDPKWHAARKLTIGGSSFAILMGLNAFTTLREYLSQKLGLTHFVADIKPQWGNLFEEVIKRQVEHMYGCTIYGEDLFVLHETNRGITYSPDGLAIVDGECVLFEFKCPYSRIPGAAVPVYYVPQVKMGLEVLAPPQYGIYAEAVFRRCAWRDCGPTRAFDTTLVARPCPNGTPPLAYGFVGVYGPVANTGASTCDLGACSVAFFTKIMALIDSHKLSVWYSQEHRATTRSAAASALNRDLAAFREHVSARAEMHIVGLIPWKLLKCNTHRIDKTPGFMDPYLDELNAIVDFLHSCINLDDAAKKKALDDFMRPREQIPEWD